MRALVVYESHFGNTGAVAEAVAEGLRPVFDVTVADVRTRPPLGDADLLVVGAPTHAFSLSRPRTRADARQRGATRTDAAEIGLREFLDHLPRISGVPAAAFDTKMAKPALPGSAARKAHRCLRNLGCRMLADAGSFHVTGMSGPLADGELDRARRWGAALAAAASSHSLTQPG